MRGHLSERQPAILPNKKKEKYYFFLSIQIFLTYFPESVIGIKVEAQAA